jgi:hypothetical protein
VEFSQIDGLAAKFKGIKERNITLNKKPKTTRKASSSSAKSDQQVTKKRIRVNEGTEIGHAPMKRKPKAD